MAIELKKFATFRWRSGLRPAKWPKTLSPHLSVYEPQVPSMFSIFHRMGGSVLALTFVMLALGHHICCGIFFFPAEFVFLQQLSTAYFGLFVALFLFLVLTLCYHMNNGLRHFLWDLGLFFKNEQVVASARVVTITTLLSFFGLIVYWFFLKLFSST